MVSLFAFWYVFQHVDLSSIYEKMKNVKWYYVVCAFFLFNTSQMASAARLGYILKNHKAEITFPKNLLLYYIGMAYNLFLPGGIGGDAYKILQINRIHKYKKKTLVSALLLDRLLGLLALLILILTGLTFFNLGYPKSVWIFSAILVLIFSFIGTKIFFKQGISFGLGFLWSLLIQLLQGLSFYSIVWSLGYKSLASAIIFWISSVATAIPVFLGGMGARELIFEKLAQTFQINSTLGITAALIFSLITLVSSFVGLVLDWIPKNHE